MIRHALTRRLAGCAVAVCSLLLAAVAWGSQASSARGGTRGTSAGTVVSVDGSTFTIQTPGRQVGVVNALTGAADHVTQQDYPYVYGGGHEQAGVASIGIPGPGYNGHRIGYDCSGAVAAALVAAGLWPPGTGVPSDAGMISQLRAEHLIAPGVGQGPVEVTLYDNWGVHIFMNIDGRFFGTSDGGGGGNRHGGAGWLYDGAPDASSPRYKAFHFVPSALRGSVSTGHIITFSQREGSGVPLQVGDKVKVAYRETRSGSFVASEVAFPGEHTVSGTVSELGQRGKQLTITTAQGSTMTFGTVDDSILPDGLAPGATVQVTYTKRDGVLTARSVTITAVQPPPTGPTEPPPTGSSQPSTG